MNFFFFFANRLLIYLERNNKNTGVNGGETASNQVSVLGVEYQIIVDYFMN